MGLASIFLGDSNPFSQWAAQNSGLLGSVGGGIAAGTNLGQGLSYAAQSVPQGKALDFQAQQQREAAQKAEALTAQAEALKSKYADFFNQNGQPDYARAVADGIMEPGAAYEDWMKAKSGAPAQNPYMNAGDGTFFNWQNGEFVTNPTAQTKLPKAPENYRWTPDGTSLEAIPGGPADVKSGLTTDRKMVATDTIVNAAASARKLVDSGVNTGVVGAVMGMNSQSQAAELRRQVDVLKSNASIENLTAMRQASPTGGALGSVTERENAMLASAAGALNPDADAADFKKALDNYELTLLQIVHGPEVGRQIFAATRDGAGASPAGPSGSDPDVENILKQYGVQ